MSWRWAGPVVADALDFSDPIPGALTGGVFLKGVLLEGFFREAAQERNLKLEPIQKVEKPARGALVLALRCRQGF